MDAVCPVSEAQQGSTGSPSSGLERQPIATGSSPADVRTRERVAERGLGRVEPRRLVALEQIVLHGNLEPATLEELKERLETIAARMETASEGEAQAADGYLAYYQKLLDTALAKEDAVATPDHSRNT